LLKNTTPWEASAASVRLLRLIIRNSRH